MESRDVDADLESGSVNIDLEAGNFPSFLEMLEGEELVQQTVPTEGKLTTYVFIEIMCSLRVDYINR